MQSFVVLTLFGASILWGLTWLPLKHIHSLGFNGVPITLFVYLVMFVITLPFLWHFRALIGRHARILVVILILGGGAQLAFNTAMVYGDVIRVMVLFYLIPLWGVLGGRIILGEQITPLRWLGMAMSIMGAFLVVGGFNAFETPPTWIDLLALLSGFLFAMNNISFRISPDVPVMMKLSSMFLGAFMLAGIVVTQTGEQVVPDVSISAWWILIAYGAIWVMLANLGTQWAVTHMEAGKSSIIIIFELITAVVSASLILGESMSGIEMLGGALILGAALLEAKQPDGTPAEVLHHDGKK